MFENMNKTKAHRTLSRRDGVISPTEMRRLKAALAQLDDLDERIEPEDDWDDSVHFSLFSCFRFSCSWGLPSSPFVARGSQWKYRGAMLRASSSRFELI